MTTNIPAIASTVRTTPRPIHRLAMYGSFSCRHIHTIRPPIIPKNIGNRNHILDVVIN